MIKNLLKTMLKISQSIMKKNEFLVNLLFKDNLNFNNNQKMITHIGIFFLFHLKIEYFTQ